MKPHIRRIAPQIWCCGERFMLDCWRTGQPLGAQAMQLIEHLAFGSTPGSAFYVWKGKQ